MSILNLNGQPYGEPEQAPTIARPGQQQVRIQAVPTQFGPTLTIEVDGQLQGQIPMPLDVAQQVGVELIGLVAIFRQLQKQHLPADSPRIFADETGNGEDGPAPA